MHLPPKFYRHHANSPTRVEAMDHGGMKKDIRNLGRRISASEDDNHPCPHRRDCDTVVHDNKVMDGNRMIGYDRRISNYDI
jgi:hypothetical protein